MKQLSHTSDDGLLTLIVDSVSWEQIDGSDQTVWFIKFQGCQWDCDEHELKLRYSSSAQEAFDRFIGDIVEDRLVLKLQYFGDKLYDACVVDEREVDVERMIQEDRSGLYSSERLVYRYWSGRLVGGVGAEGVSS